MSPKEEGAWDKVVPPRRKSGKKVLASQGNVDDIPRKQPRDTTEDTLASTPVVVKMSPKEEGARDKVVPPRRKRGKKVLASQGIAEEIPRTQLRDTAQKTSASTQEGVKMLPKEKGARNKVVSPQLQWKKALSQEEEVTKVPRSQPEDVAIDLAADAQKCKVYPLTSEGTRTLHEEHSPKMDEEKLNVCTMPAEEVSDRKPCVVMPPMCFKRTEALITGHEDAHPTDGTEERRYLAEVDPENHQPSTELAVSDQQEDDRMDQIVVAGDNNLKGGVIPHHNTPKQENPGISNQQDVKQFGKGSAAEEKPLKPAKIPITREQIPITMEQLFRFLTAAMDLLIQWLTVGRDTPGQETTNPQMRHEFPGFGPPKKVITARRTRFTFQQTREQWQAMKILAYNPWPSARTKRPCEEVTRGSLPQTEWKTKTSPVPKETARLADIGEIRSDTLRQTDKAQKVIMTELPQTEWKTKKNPVPKEAARLADLKEIRSDTLCQTDKAWKVITIGHQGNTRFKPYDKGDLEWVVGTNPETIYPTAKLGPKQQGLFEVLKQLSNAVHQVEILRQWKNHNVFQVNLIVPDMETELHGPNFTQLMRRTISTKSRRRSTRREDARHRRRTPRVKTRESRQMNMWTHENEAEFGENNDKRTTSPTRKDIPQLICFSPSNILS
jgi:DNA-binding transcriptional regulator YiaG